MQTVCILVHQGKGLQGVLKTISLFCHFCAQAHCIIFYLEESLSRDCKTLSVVGKTSGDLQNNPTLSSVKITGSPSAGSVFKGQMSAETLAEETQMSVVDLSLNHLTLSTVCSQSF